jgi:hypothetical protein
MPDNDRSLLAGNSRAVNTILRPHSDNKLGKVLENRGS